MAQAGLALAYPEICQLCRQEPAGPDEGWVGETCRKQIRFIRPPFCESCGHPVEGEVDGAFQCPNCRDHRWAFDQARGAARAQGVVLEAIHRFKYLQETWFAAFLAGLIRDSLSPRERWEKPWDAVVPVPLHPRKLKERGFNQAVLIGGILARELGLPLEASWVRRVRDTPTQTRLDRKERLGNLQHAFHAMPRPRVPGTVLLLDDVLTTGATLSSCAEALKQSGVRRVEAWAVARGLSSPPLSV